MLSTIVTTESAGDGSVARVLELLWRGRTEQRAPVRGPRPTLTLDAIVEAAVGLADREGLAAVSMRRVATELGAGTMTLYRYLHSKDELLGLMTDSIILGPDPAECRKGWRATLEAFAHSSWAEFRAHPWLLSVNQSRQVLGPRALAAMEVALAGLDGLGLTGRDRVSMVLAVLHATEGCARNYLQHDEVLRESGVSDEDFWAAHLPVLEKAMASGDYPQLAELEDDAWNIGGETARDLAVTAVLDGLERFVAERGAPEAGR